MRAPAAARAEGARAGALYRALGARLRGDDRVLRPRPARGARATSCTTLAGHASPRSRSRSCLAVIIPKGFFPQQDTGLHPRRLRGRAGRLVPADDGAAADASPTSSWRTRTSQSVASFIGSDGTNPTTNSGRLSITLKPRDERNVERRRDHRAPRSRSSPQVDGHHRLPAVGPGPADRQPRQPHAVPVHARGRRPDRARRPGRPKLLDRAARSCPSSRTSRAIRRPPGCRCRSTIDRDTASRLGISPQVIDDTLYDAFGQRQVSIIFTQLNLYRVILEVKPEFAAEPGGARQTLRRARRRATPVPLSAIVALERRRRRPLAINHQGQFPAVTHLVQPAPTASRSATRSTAIQRGAGAHRRCRRASTPTSRARRRRSASRSRASRCSSWPRSSPSTSCSACSTRATSTRSRSSRRCRRPASARSSRSCVCQTDFSVIALIGIVLLIGIVKKNAIMMIDFALEAERDHGHDAARRRSTRRACCASGRS